MTKVQLLSWNKGFSVIRLVKFIREYTEFGLSDAKMHAEKFLEGQQIELSIVNFQTIDFEALIDLKVNFVIYYSA